MEYVPFRNEDEEHNAEVVERYKKWIEDGKPGISIEERLADIDISRELEILGLDKED